MSGQPPPSLSDQLKLLYSNYLEQCRSENKSPVWFTRYSVPAEVGPLSTERLASDAWDKWCKDGVVCFGFRSVYDVLKIYFGNPKDQSVYHVVDFDCCKFNPSATHNSCFILVGSKIYLIGGVNVYSCDVTKPPSGDTGVWEWSERPKLPTASNTPFNVMLFCLLGNLYAVLVRESSTELHVLKLDTKDWEVATAPPTSLGVMTLGCFVFEEGGHKKFLVHTTGLKDMLSVYDAIVNEWTQFDYPFDYPKLSSIFSNLDSLLVTRTTESFVVSCFLRLFGLVDFMGIDLDSLLHRKCDAFCHLLPIGDQKFCFLALYGEGFLTDGLSDDEEKVAGEDGFCFVRFGTLEFQQQQHVEHGVGDTKRQKFSGYKVVNSNLKNIRIADFTLNLEPLEFCSKSGTF